MPTTLKTIAVSLAATAAVTGGLLFTADQGEASPPKSQTEKRTLAFLKAVEREDLAAVDKSLHPDIVHTQPMTFDGDQEPDIIGTGRDEVLDYYRETFARMSQIRFFDTQVSVTKGGKVAFVEVKGDFTAADGRAYDNVYLMRFEWTPDGRLLRTDDYYNPVILCNSFPENPAC